MSSLLLILLSSVLVSYFAIARIGPLQPFASNDHFESALGIALVTLIDLAVLAPLAFVLDHAVLRPLQIAYLAPVVFIVLILLVAFASEAALLHQGRWIPQRPGFVSMMTSQGALFGVTLLGRFRSATLGEAALLGLGSGISFALLLLAFCSLQQRLRAANIPQPFASAPVGLITVGIMALALMGMTGLIRE